MNKKLTTKERILHAAFELISSKGYLGASTREIAKAAGVAEVTLFRNFNSKENLFTEVLRSFSTIPTLPELLPDMNNASYEEAVKDLARQLITRLVEVRDWIRILNTEAGSSSENLQPVFTEFMDHVFGVLTEFFEDAHTRHLIRNDLEPLYAARTFHSLIFGLFHVEGLSSLNSTMETQPNDLLNVYVDIFCHGTINTAAHCFSYPKKNKDNGNTP